MTRSASLVAQMCQFCYIFLCHQRFLTSSWQTVYCMHTRGCPLTCDRSSASTDVFPLFFILFFLFSLSQVQRSSRPKSEEQASASRLRPTGSSASLPLSSVWTEYL
jgi:hypothetical protein